VKEKLDILNSTVKTNKPGTQITQSKFPLAGAAKDIQPIINCKRLINFIIFQVKIDDKI